MKTSVRLLFVCVSLLATGSLAQRPETFDIATFQPPKGWKRQEKDGSLIFITADNAKGTYALITMYQSGASKGNAKSDFDAEWEEFVAGQLEIDGKPDIQPIEKIDGWQVISGGTAFEKEMGPSAVILRTYSGFGKVFSAAAIFNSQDYMPAIEAFAASIKLDKTAATPATTPEPTATGDSENSILGTWGSNAGASMTYGDPVAAGMAGYTKGQYTFNANGTYTFIAKTFRMGYDKIILIKENGTYRISGDTLSIKPQKSVIQAWSKLNGGDDWGRLLSTQNRKLEAVSYKFTKHYFSGIQEWNLVLQADHTTDRDGPYSTFTLFPNAWYYKPISSNNPVIVLPK